MSKTKIKMHFNLFSITHDYRVRQWKFSSTVLKNLSNLYLMITLFQNMNPSNIQQCINERVHSLKRERGFCFNFWSSDTFELEEQTVPQPTGHLLTLSPVNPMAKDTVMEQPRQLGYTPLSK